MIINFEKFKLNEFKDIEESGKTKERFFMDKLYDKLVKELMPKVPKVFDIYYDGGKKIEIRTKSKKDLMVGAEIVNDLINIYADRVDDTDYTYSYTFDPFNLISIYEHFVDEFDRDKILNSDLKKKEELKKEEPKKKEPSLKDLVKRPRKLSIKDAIVEDVLANAFIKEEMKFPGKLTVEELMRRMRSLNDKI